MEDLTGIDAWTGIGTSLCGIANRVSHLLDLRGPSVALDAACAASLVAVHQACQMLRAGEDIAGAGRWGPCTDRPGPDPGARRGRGNRPRRPLQRPSTPPRTATGAARAAASWCWGDSPTPNATVTASWPWCAVVPRPGTGAPSASCRRTAPPRRRWSGLRRAGCRASTRPASAMS